MLDSLSVIVDSLSNHEIDNMLKPYYKGNPNSKWTWYDIEGRYNQRLLVKETVTDFMISDECISLDIKVAPKGYIWVDGAKIKDIMFPEVKDIMDTVYQKVLRFWELYVDKESLNPGEQLPMCIFEAEYFKDYYHTKETYAYNEALKNNLFRKFHTESLLTEEGWFDLSGSYHHLNDEGLDAQAAYLKKYNEVLHDPENQEKYLVIVDCSF